MHAVTSYPPPLPSPPNCYRWRYRRVRQQRTVYNMRAHTLPSHPLTRICILRKTGLRVVAFIWKFLICLFISRLNIRRESRTTRIYILYIYYTPPAADTQSAVCLCALTTKTSLAFRLVPYYYIYIHV